MATINFTVLLHQNYQLRLSNVACASTSRAQLYFKQLLTAENPRISSTEARRMSAVSIIECAPRMVRDGYLEGSKLSILNYRKIKRIKIRHPFYSDKINVFLRVPAVDTLNSEAGTYKATKNEYLNSAGDINRYNDVSGCHHGTLALACYILAGNKKGVLSPTRLLDQKHLDEHVNKVETKGSAEYATILTGNEYYFYPEDYFEKERYRIVRKFEEWMFPEQEELQLNRIFQIWTTAHNNSSDPEGGFINLDYEVADTSEVVKIRDNSCRFTGSGDPLEAWIENSMNMFAGREPSSDPTNVVENLISLRRDIRFVMDEGSFCIAVKVIVLIALKFCLDDISNDALEIGKYLCRAFCSSEHIDTLRRLHNQPLHLPVRTPLEYLFARFGWTYIRQISPGFLIKQEEYDEKFGGIGSEVAAGSPLVEAEYNLEVAKDTDEPTEALPTTRSGKIRHSQTVRGRRVRRGAGRNAKTSQTGDGEQEYFQYNGGFNHTIDRVTEARKIRKLAHEYKRSHPEISAVANRNGPFMEEFDSDCY
ncbi:hypothetical protein H072_7248 [Dactylellina haptotyla CBS 200.50]|uniref:Uncharacterized protein n=1 Tax=Dactylellina haptotyla (strain CBS 200.50) TaxID=1284197 RepID=S8A7L3_DACHA|nr:hypothetical protein H072_7248 [Dactylellina haptotyla CBS 200.50]